MPRFTNGQLQKIYFKEHILMATSVAEINSLSLSSEILFSKSFSHIKTSQPHS